MKYESLVKEFCEEVTELSHLSFICGCGFSDGLSKKLS